ncbi:GNAT family N-acetyltransferase [bacterium]|nr:GNAT family N-acetyltransferase [bacterium]
MLGICEQLVREPDLYQDPFFAAVFDEADDELLLAAVMTPPRFMILAGGEDFKKALPALIGHLQEHSIEPPGIIGPVQIGEAFADLWHNRTSQVADIDMQQRVYELRHVRLPKIPEGRFRLAHPDEAVLLAEWIKTFEEEALTEQIGRYVERAKKFITRGDMFFWEAQNELVSMAMKSRPLKNSITVSAVYTPPRHRQQGYATALVAQLSQHLLDMGYEFVNLFTDLDNPTSNSIYQKIGYHPVVDFRMYKFRKEPQQ